MTISYQGTMYLQTKNKFVRSKNEFLMFRSAKLAPANITPLDHKGHQPTFQQAMKLPIIIGQCFGLLPVLGICELDASKLRFKFCSAKFVYSLLTSTAQGVLLLLIVLKLLTNTNSSLTGDSSIVFYMANFIQGVLFFRLAIIWPKLCQRIAKAEAVDPNTNKNLVRSCNIACVSVLLLAALEHILSDISGIAIAIDCQPDTSVHKAFILQSYPFLWTFVPYTDVIGFLAVFVNIQCTFNWNFADAFVICISLYLTSRLKQITKRVKDVSGKYAPATFWRTLREDYSRTIYMVKKLDDAVSGIIFVSFANNLFIICMQLLHTLEDGIQQTPGCHSRHDDRPMNGYEQAVYFIYSFSFLLTRSLAVSLIAAGVHSASRAPAEYLYDVPSTAYCSEVQRFLNQVNGETVALTGLQFFNVKRGLVLTITGTIITYELVLMQFAGSSLESEETVTALPSPFTNDSAALVNVSSSNKI